MALDPQPSDDVTQPGELLSTGLASRPGAVGASKPRRAIELQIGDVLGDYVIEGRLGAGGMGEVFAARKRSAESPVALKVLAQAGSTALYRFKREFRALADVRHPNLITLHELVVPSEGVPFFTMELIEGVPFHEYVRGRTARGKLPNLVRLGRALGQLLIGVHALHLAGRQHRDIKPSNVLVTRAGRVVILDFGLVSERGEQREDEVRLTNIGAPLGTPAYMAPEQALSGQSSESVDYYAIGTMLFECLTGSLPFEGSPLEVMLHKQGGEVPDPWAKVPEVPGPLREVCMRLLAFAPEERPTAEVLLSTLDELELRSVTSSSGSGSSGGGGQFPGLSLSSSSLVASDARSAGAPFVGRRAEIGSLTAALRDVEETEQAISVHVRGGSGLGKSALLSRFLSRARRKHDVLVLSGRCFARESVPYKGIDAIIDALSLQLRRMPHVELAGLRPRAIGPLTRIFPVLRDVWETPGTPGPGDAAELRRLGLAALRELLLGLAARRPVLLCIDDFQWADLDSVRLLNVLLRPPSAPALLVVLGLRVDVELPRGAREAMAELDEPAARSGQDVRELELGPLAEQDAVELAMQLMGERADPELARSYVERSGGNPFYLTQLVIGAVLGGEATAALSVDELVAQRILALDEQRRVLLALVAVAGGPVETTVLLELLELEPPTTLAQLLEPLVAHGLLVRGRSPVSEANDEPALGGGEPPVEITHGYIRDVVLGELEAGELECLHLRLAEALEAQDGDLETIAQHYALGGDAERAAIYTERAAESAAEALAFAHAVELYERTLELLPPRVPAAKRHALRLALAMQLRNTGHGARAADILLELAVVSKPEDARSYRRRAAEQLLCTGRVDEGLDLSSTLFEEVGERIPRGFWGAVWMFVRERTRLWLRRRARGPRLRLRSAEQVPEQLLTRLDLLSSVTTGLWLQEIVFAQALHSRALVLAYEAGEPRRLGLALSLEFVTLAARGRYDEARAMMIECRELAAQVDEVELDRAIDLSAAMIDWFASRMGLARVRLGELLRRLERAPGADWIRAYAAIRYAEACVYGGHLAELRRELPRWIATARDHGNLHELVSLLGISASVALHYDDLDDAKRSLALAQGVWDSSRYTVPDLTMDLSALNVEVKAGDLEVAKRRLEGVVRGLHEGGMSRVAVLREQLALATARYEVRVALRFPEDLQLRRRLARECVRLRGAVGVLARGEVMIFEAALHSLDGDVAAMRRSWREAEVLLEERGQRTALAAVRLRLAALSKGREAADYETRALAYLSEQGIPNRKRYVEWLAPARLDT